MSSPSQYRQGGDGDDNERTNGRNLVGRRPLGDIFNDCTNRYEPTQHQGTNTNEKNAQGVGRGGAPSTGTFWPAV